MCTIDDAARAYYMFMIERFGGQPMQLNGDGWEQDTDRTFFHRDEDGDKDVRVRFVGGDGDARVTLRDGISGVVNIWDDELADELDDAAIKQE